MVKQNIIKDIGAKIKMLREQQGLSQKDLGKKFKATAQVVSNIECGKQNVTLGTLTKICDALGYEITIFFSNIKATSYTSCSSSNIKVTWDKSSQT